MMWIANGPYPLIKSKKKKVLAISAQTGEGLDKLVTEIFKKL